MNKQSLSVVLATKNEEKNIGECLESVKGLAEEIIVFDEDSIDDTKKIAKKYGAKTFTYKHEINFHETKQKAIERATCEWVLQLDADEKVTPELSNEIKSVINMTYSEILEYEMHQSLKNPKFKFIHHDVSRELPEGLEGDYIYHIASPASPNQNSPKSYHSLPFETMSVNTNGTWNLAKLSARIGGKFLFASTSEVYGDPEVSPQTESYKGNVSTIGPRSVYDESKRFGETITSAFIRSKALDGRIIRIFNTYGPRLSLDDGRVVTEFIKAALKGETIPLFGDGTQTRSFMFIDDLVSGIILAMESENTKNEVFNLGNPDEFKIIELAEKVKEITHSDSEIKQVAPLPEDDPKQRCPDITKAKEKLGWEPAINLDEGLKKMVQYLKPKIS